MKFKIGDFIVYTEKVTEELSEKIAVATDVSHSGKPSEYKMRCKTRDLTIFEQLDFLEKKDNTYYRVITDLFEFIDLIELLKAYTSNKLDTSKTYRIGKSFTAKIAQKNSNMCLSIYFTNYSDDLKLDKFECSALAAKFGKILQRCEAWAE